MGEKPSCSCWQDPQTAAQREQMVDGIGTAVQVSVDQSCEQMGICSKAAPYVGGSIVAAILFWVAFELRGDGVVPTHEQISEAGELVVRLARERLEGARQHDLDNVQTATDSVH